MYKSPFFSFKTRKIKGRRNFKGLFFLSFRTKCNCCAHHRSRKSCSLSPLRRQMYSYIALLVLCLHTSTYSSSSSSSLLLLLSFFFPSQVFRGSFLYLNQNVCVLYVVGVCSRRENGVPNVIVYPFTRSATHIFSFGNTNLKERKDGGWRMEIDVCNLLQ